MLAAFDSGYHDVMQGGARSRLQGGNKRTPTRHVVGQKPGVTAEYMGLESLLLEIVAQLGCSNTVGILRIESLLNIIHIRSAVLGFSLLLPPILDDHGYRGSPTPFPRLFDKWDVEPPAALCERPDRTDRQN